MRILHVPYHYYPDAVGGTEVYVDGLTQSQRALGDHPMIAAPGHNQHYEHSGIPVWRFPVSPDTGLRDLYGDGDRIAARGFGEILDKVAPDVVHLHAVTSAISVRLAEQAANRGVPVILNYHTPTVSCARGTLLRWGTTICDGKLDFRTCTACSLQSHGLARPIAKAVASMPLTASRMIGNTSLSGPLWTALRMPELIELRIQAFHRLVRIAFRVVALCNWTRELLLRNGVPDSRISLCRQGIVWQPDDAYALRPRAANLPLRVAFLGRLDPAKGVPVVAEALKTNPDLPVCLDIFGIVQDKDSNQHAASMKTAIAGDPRIRLLPSIPYGEVVPRLREYDLVVVPSQWLETGPLVVLEAFAAGTPVMGSNLGGIAELVTDGVDGLLVDPFSAPEAWAESLRRVCASPELLLALRAGIRPPRQSRQAALDFMPLYEEAVREHRTAPVNA
jgi:glycosyltransferase involved in cell wall biosynthesis